MACSVSQWRRAGARGRRTDVVGQVQIPQVDSQVVAQRAGGREGRAEQPTTRSAEARAFSVDRSNRAPEAFGKTEVPMQGNLCIDLTEIWFPFPLIRTF